MVNSLIYAKNVLKSSFVDCMCGKKAAIEIVEPSSEKGSYNI